MGTAVDGGHHKDTTTALERNDVGGNSRGHGQVNLYAGVAAPAMHEMGCASRYWFRKMRPEVARDALLATHGGISYHWLPTS
jgi:hypothetical protein